MVHYKLYNWKLCKVPVHDSLGINSYTKNMQTSILLVEVRFEGSVHWCSEPQHIEFVRYPVNCDICDGFGITGCRPLTLTIEYIDLNVHYLVKTVNGIKECHKLLMGSTKCAIDLKPP